MSRHVAQSERDYGAVLAVVCLLLALLVAIGWTQTSKPDAGVGIPTATESITAETAALNYVEPQVTTTAAPPAPAPTLPAVPIPPCTSDRVGPGTPPCHWDSGQYGGSQSFVWTGEYKITLIEPRP